MKVNDSEMPEEDYWNSLFNLDQIINWLDIANHSTIVEIGCGYGTFSVPVANVNKTNQLYVFDIEQEMLDQTRLNIQKAKLDNVEFILRDVLTDGSGLESGSADMVLLFNILHSEYNTKFIKEAYRILKPKGIIAIIHWRKDIATPRGPDVSLRPDPESIKHDCQNIRLKPFDSPVTLTPYHWGMKLKKANEN